MALGGFLQGLGLAIGNDMIQGQAFQQRQAQADLMKSEAQRAQMQNAQMQQQMKTQQDIGGFIKSQTELEGADAALPMNQDKMYSKAAGLAASLGDLASAKEMTDLSKQATQEGMEQAKQLATQQAVKKEALATTASALPDQPSQGQMADLVRKAVDAGVDPMTIPPPGSPALLKWKNDMTLAGMDSAKKAEFIQKGVEMKLTRDQHEKDHMDNVATARASLQATAAYRDGLLQEHRDAAAARADKDSGPDKLVVGGSIYLKDPGSKLNGERLAAAPMYVKVGNNVSTTQENNTIATGKAAANVSRDLDQMGRFPTGTANSPFAHITDHDFLSSIAKAGSNALTPEQVQMFGTSTGGMSTELGRVLTIGAGRGANQSLINEVKTFTTPNAGDTNLEAAYKMATAAQMVKTTMENTPPPNDQSVRKGWDATLAKVSSFPSPEEILKAASGPQRKQLSTLDGTYTQLLGKVQDAVTKNNSEPLPGGADVGAGTSLPPLPAGGGLPPGVTVRIH
jgi:hypothetical protein